MAEKRILLPPDDWRLLRTVELRLSQTAWPSPLLLLLLLLCDFLLRLDNDPGMVDIVMRLKQK